MKKVVVIDGSWTSNSRELFQELNAYWSSAESWTQGQRDSACMVLEDRYSVFRPNMPASYTLKALDLWNHIRHLGWMDGQYRRSKPSPSPHGVS